MPVTGRVGEDGLGSSRRWPREVLQEHDVGRFGRRVIAERKPSVLSYSVIVAADLVAVSAGVHDFAIVCSQPVEDGPGVRQCRTAGPTSECVQHVGATVVAAIQILLGVIASLGCEGRSNHVPNVSRRDSHRDVSGKFGLATSTLVCENDLPVYPP